MAKWDDRLEQFLAERAPASGTLPQDWVHSAIYVLNAASARVEQPEVEIVRKLQSSKVPVQVVLTMCDKASADEVENLKNFLHESIPGLHITEVCSVSIRKRSGTSVSFGRDVVLDELVCGIDTELSHALIDAVCDRLEKEIEICKRVIIKAFDDSNLSFYNLVKGFIQEGDDFEMDSLLGFDFDNVFDAETKEFDDINQSIDLFLEALGRKSRSKISTSEIIARIRESVESATDSAGSVIEAEFNKEIEAIDSGDFWTAVASIGRVTGKVIRIKSFMRGCILSVLAVASKEVDIQRVTAHDIVKFMNSGRTV